MTNRQRPCALILLFLLSLTTTQIRADEPAPSRTPATSPAPAAMAPTATVAVGPVSPLPAGALQVARLMDVPWARLQPGTEVLVAPGIQPGPVTIDARGSAAQPIVVRPAGAAGSVEIELGVDFQRASHVSLSGMRIEASPWSAVMIRAGSDHITVAGNTLRRSDIGVGINADAGTGHQIVDNLIEDSTTVGIAVDRARSSPTDRSRIAGNQVLRSGHHGMEIHGSNYLIERNTTAWSGMSLGGTSGIHLYSASADEDTGDDNIVRYNFSHHNRDPWLSDGNGIQVDQYCDRNEIAFNVAWANDGAGIIVFDGADNVVQGNTTKANGLNSGGTHGDLGEIIVNSAGPHLNRSRGNRVFDNVVVATLPAVAAIFVDYTTAPNNNTIGPNLHHHRAGGTLLQRGAQLGRTAAEIDRINATPGNLVEAPRFVREGAPLKHGLKLARPPSGPGHRVADDRDMLGLPALPQFSFFGAYYTAPASR